MEHKPATVTHASHSPRVSRQGSPSAASPGRSAVQGLQGEPLRRELGQDWIKLNRKTHELDLIKACFPRDSQTRVKIEQLIKDCDRLEGQVRYTPAAQLRRPTPSRAGEPDQLSVADKLDRGVAGSVAWRVDRLDRVSRLVQLFLHFELLTDGQSVLRSRARGWSGRRCRS